MDGLCGDDCVYQSASSRGVILKLRHIYNEADLSQFKAKYPQINDFLNGSKVRNELFTIWKNGHRLYKNEQFDPSFSIEFENNSEYKIFEQQPSEWEYFFKRDPFNNYFQFRQYPLPEVRKKDFRQKHYEEILGFINNPLNNGKKLMQYIQTNLSEEMLSENREQLLKKKAQKEIERLNKINSLSSRSKAIDIRLAISTSSYCEKKLRSSLLIHRGFFKNMPDSYSNVFCKEDIPSSHYTK